jgi:hypothetical protein
MLRKICGVVLVSVHGIGGGDGPFVLCAAFVAEAETVCRVYTPVTG